jgi:SPP1 family predicted phage head-tail adaptor
MAILAGKLRHRVEIQTATETPDGMGQPIKSWSTTGRAWAAIEPASGREAMLGQLQQSTVAVNVTMRYQPGIAAGQRLKYGARIFNIGAVLNVEERNTELRLSCTEVV